MFGLFVHVDRDVLVKGASSKLKSLTLVLLLVDGLHYFGVGFSSKLKLLSETEF